MAYQIVKSAAGVQESPNKCEVMIESAADLETLPEDIAPGSVAYTADFSVLRMKALDGSWAEIGG